MFRHTKSKKKKLPRELKQCKLKKCDMSFWSDNKILCFKWKDIVMLSTVMPGLTLKKLFIKAENKSQKLF